MVEQRTKDNECSLQEVGISNIDKRVTCFCDGSPYEHFMSSYCVKRLKAKLKEYEDAPIWSMHTNNGVKFIK